MRVVVVCFECTDDLKHAICCMICMLFARLATFHDKHQYPHSFLSTHTVCSEKQE